MSDFYETNFLLKKDYNYSFDELDGMMPWERSVYVELLRQYLEKKANDARNAAQHQ